MNRSMSTMTIRELTATEIDEVAGGPIVVPIAVAAAIVMGAAAGGYKTGSDAAKRDNAEDDKKSDDCDCTCSNS